MTHDRMPEKLRRKIIDPKPYRDEATGEIVPNDPPLNTKGFWDKPKVTTADYVKKNKHTAKANKR